MIMFLDDLSHLPPAIRHRIEKNPFTEKFNELKMQSLEAERRLENIDSEIRSWQSNIQRYKVNRGAFKATLDKTRKQLAALTKAQEATDNEFTCEFLDVDRMTKFFESLGMKFISLSFSTGGSEAHLNFIRPARTIEGMPVQPLVIRLKYSTGNSSNLTVDYARAFHSLEAHNGNNIHPHIATSMDICMGDYADVLNNENVSFALESYQDHVILLDNLLSTYNPDSPYLAIDQILMNILDNGLNWRSTNVSVKYDTNCPTLVNPKLSKARREYQVRDLITPTLYQEFYDMFNGLKLSSILDDLEARLVNWEHSDDSYEMHEEFIGIRNKLVRLLGAYTELSEVWEYATNESEDEDEEDYRLYEDDMESLIGSWQKSFKEIRKRADYNELLVKAPRLPDLSEAFPSGGRVVMPESVSTPMPEIRMPAPQAPTTFSDLF